MKADEQQQSFINTLKNFNFMDEGHNAFKTAAVCKDAVNAEAKNLMDKNTEHEKDNNLTEDGFFTLKWKEALVSAKGKCKQGLDGKTAEEIKKIVADCQTSINAKHDSVTEYCKKEIAELKVHMEKAFTSTADSLKARCEIDHLDFMAAPVDDVAPVEVAGDVAPAVDAVPVEG